MTSTDIQPMTAQEAKEVADRLRGDGTLDCEPPALAATLRAYAKQVETIERLRQALRQFALSDGRSSTHIACHNCYENSAAARQALGETE